MLGNAIGWIFDVIGSAWTAFWNALGRFLGLLVFTVLGGAIFAAALKLYGAMDSEAWVAFKYGAAAGFAIGALRLVILAHTNVVHTQLQREKARQRREIDALARRDSQRASISDRLKLVK